MLCSYAAVNEAQMMAQYQKCKWELIHYYSVCIHYMSFNLGTLIPSQFESPSIFYHKRNSNVFTRVWMVRKSMKCIFLSTKGAENCSVLYGKEKIKKVFQWSAKCFIICAMWCSLCNLWEKKLFFIAIRGVNWSIVKHIGMCEHILRGMEKRELGEHENFFNLI